MAEGPLSFPRFAFGSVELAGGIALIVLGYLERVHGGHDVLLIRSPGVEWTIEPDGFHQRAVATVPPTGNAGQLTTITVQARDQYGNNLVSSGGSVTVAVIAGTSPVGELRGLGSGLADLLATDLAGGLELAGFDLVVSNPPYVDPGELAGLPAGVIVGAVVHEGEIVVPRGETILAPQDDVIVDLVSTGSTLKANGLAEVEHIADISAWLVGNQASMKMKHATLKPLVEKLRAAAKG